MIQLCSGVYLVKGAAGACLYDLAHKKLWHIGMPYAELLEQCAAGKKTACTDAEQAALEQLAANGLLRFGAPVPLPDITSLRHTPQIRQAWIEICTGCNLRCLHCYNDAVPDCSGNMPPEDFRLVCRRLKEAGIQRVQLIGGEPLCHPELQQMLTESAAVFDRTELFTNGTLLTPALCRLLKTLGIFAAVSVYSYLPEMHDKVTQVRGSHAKSVQALAMLKEAGVPCRTAAVRMKGIDPGEKQADTFYTIGQPYDVIRMAGRGNAGLLSPELLRSKLITKETFRAPLRPESVRDAVSGNPCFSKKIYVAHDLQVYPCVMERRMSHGSLREKPLHQILRQEILHLGKDQIAGCKVCEYRYACPDCRPDTLSEGLDSAYEKPYFCAYFPEKGVWMNESEKNALICSLCGEKGSFSL